MQVRQETNLSAQRRTGSTTPVRLAIVALGFLVIALAWTNVITLMHAEAHAKGYRLISSIFSVAGPTIQTQLFGDSATERAERRLNAAVSAAVEAMRGPLTMATREALLSDHIRTVAVAKAVAVMQEKLANYISAWESSAIRVQDLEQRDYIRLSTSKPIYLQLKQRMGHLVARNAGTFVVKAIPAFGQAAVMVLTINDIVDACNSIKEVDRLMLLDGLDAKPELTFCLF